MAAIGTTTGTNVIVQHTTSTIYNWYLDCVCCTAVDLFYYYTAANPTRGGGHCVWSPISGHIALVEIL